MAAVPMSRCEQCVYPIVVGIGGATRSGKSSLASSLHAHFKNSSFISQDYFFKDRKDLPINVATGVKNWESVESIDWERFEQSICEITNIGRKFCKSCKPKTKSPTIQYLFIEGFLLYQPRTMHLFDFLIFLSINKEVCHTRRMTTKKVSEDYFQKYLWPCYLQNSQTIVEKIYYQHEKESLKEPLDEKRILVLDGKGAKDEVFQKAIQHIEGHQVACEYQSVFEVFDELGWYNANSNS